MNKRRDTEVLGEIMIETLNLGLMMMINSDSGCSTNIKQIIYIYFLNIYSGTFLSVGQLSLGWSLIPHPGAQEH